MSSAKRVMTALLSLYNSTHYSIWYLVYVIIKKKKKDKSKERRKWKKAGETKDLSVFLTGRYFVFSTDITGIAWEEEGVENAGRATNAAQKVIFPG